MSGITVDPSVLDSFALLGKKKVHFLVLEIKGQSVQVAEAVENTTGGPNDYNTFADHVLANYKDSPRLFVVDVHHDLVRILYTLSLSHFLSFSVFLSFLPSNHTLHLPISITFHNLQGADGLREKVVFISWVPDSAKIKEKMTYASTAEGVKAELGGPKSIQANSMADIEEKEVLSILGFN